ncbi:TatD family hydrolase [Colwelliaceae bacterium 6441]
MFKFTDSHCHIDFPDFAENRTKLLQQCSLANITKIIIPAVSPDKWQALLALVESNNTHCQLFPCVGIHPWYLSHLDNSHLALLEQAISQHQNKLIAVGETGLDGVIAKEQDNLQHQQTFFEFHIHMANKYALPLIIHHRRTHSEILQQLKLTPADHTGIIHAFSGSYQQGKAYIDLGFKLGVGGTITYPRAEKTRKAIKRFPLDALVLETDSPAMPLFGKQGQVNTPLTIIEVFESLSGLREESAQCIAQTIENNIQQLFGIS